MAKPCKGKKKEWTTRATTSTVDKVAVTSMHWKSQGRMDVYRLGGSAGHSPETLWQGLPSAEPRNCKERGELSATLATNTHVHSLDRGGGRGAVAWQALAALLSLLGTSRAAQCLLTNLAMSGSSLTAAQAPSTLERETRLAGHPNRTNIQWRREQAKRTRKMEIRADLPQAKGAEAF